MLVMGALLQRLLVLDSRCFDIAGLVSSQRSGMKERSFARIRSGAPACGKPLVRGRRSSSGLLRSCGEQGADCVSGEVLRRPGNAGDRRARSAGDDAAAGGAGGCGRTPALQLEHADRLAVEVVGARLRGAGTPRGRGRRACRRVGFQARLVPEKRRQVDRLAVDVLVEKQSLRRGAGRRCARDGGGRLTPQRLAVLGGPSCPILLERAQPSQQCRPCGRLFSAATPRQTAALAVPLEGRRVHGGERLQSGPHGRVLLPPREASLLAGSQSQTRARAEDVRHLWSERVARCRSETGACTRQCRNRRGRLEGAAEHDGLQPLQERLGEDLPSAPRLEHPPHSGLRGGLGKQRALAAPIGHALAKPAHDAGKGVLERVAVGRRAGSPVSVAGVVQNVGQAAEGRDVAALQGPGRTVEQPRDHLVRVVLSGRRVVEAEHHDLGHSGPAQRGGRVEQALQLLPRRERTLPAAGRDVEEPRPPSECAGLGRGGGGGGADAAAPAAVEPGARRVVTRGHGVASAPPHRPGLASPGAVSESHQPNRPRRRAPPWRRGRRSAQGSFAEAAAVGVDLLVARTNRGALPSGQL
mmetsp:Transcript_24817/g.78732  ORF Transcript_24817/g.78732 Transcript_24817/m.78732 type:complete len:583 (+) Transcript_24817:597-2345(+)